MRLAARRRASVIALIATGTASLPGWLIILVAVIPTTIALFGTILATRSQRRSSREANQIGERNAVAVQRSSIAAAESVRITNLRTHRRIQVRAVR